IVGNRSGVVIAVSQVGFGMGFERGDKVFQRICAVGIIAIGVGDIPAASQSNGAVPSRVKRFAFRAMISDAPVPFLKFRNDRALVLRRTAVDDYDLQLIRNGLGLQIFQTGRQVFFRRVGR